MNDNQIDRLKKLVSEGTQIVWNPDDSICRKIKFIYPAPKPTDGDEPEPSDCAYFANGDYVALWNCEPYAFKVVSSVF